MTTSEFITKAWRGETRKTACSSVFIDGGAIYSYGYHYPLLFKVRNHYGREITVRNVTGYSNTTARHIMWSRDVDAIDINTLSTFRLTGSNSDILAELIRGQEQYIESLERYMANKKRKDTWVYSDLERRHRDAVASLNELQA